MHCDDRRHLAVNHGKLLVENDPSGKTSNACADHRR